MLYSVTVLNIVIKIFCQSVPLVLRTERGTRRVQLSGSLVVEAVLQSVALAMDGEFLVFYLMAELKKLRCMPGSPL